MERTVRARDAAILGLLAACTGTDVLGSGPDRVLDPEAPGPYAVGVTTATITDPSRERTLRVEIWYPATDAAIGATDVIDLAADAPADLVEALGDFELPRWVQAAARDAEPRGDQGTFPVVLFSHGNAAIRTQSFSLTTHLASHGYVVVAPDHPGNTLYDQRGLDSTLEDSAVHAFERPRDLSFLLDRIEARELSAVDHLADLERAAAAGHSFGAFTTLMATHPHSPRFDPRFDAAVPISPAIEPLSIFTLDLAHADRPTLYLGGTADVTTPYEELASGYQQHGGPRAMVALADVGHLGFSDMCDAALREAAAILDYPGDLIEGLGDRCGDAYAPVEWTLPRTRRFVAAWLNTYLRDSDGTARRYLDGAAPEAGVELRADR
jgi:pimeloyl-ACP methyl ester carboxylesterase